MMFYLYRQEPNRNFKYAYWMVIADEPLTKLDVWSYKKTFNCNLYTEEFVLELVKKAYPEGVQHPRPPINNRWKYKSPHINATGKKSIYKHLY